jgi:hypothetical protein
MSEVMKITERDLHEETLSCVDSERNIWIKRGFPMDKETGVFDGEMLRNLSGPPHVFMADVINLRDEKHPEGVRLENVGVIFMHGGREEGGQWMFDSIEDGYPVVETVKAVNEYLESEGEDPIRVVMACNDSPSPFGIKVGDFEAHESIVYAVGESVKFAGASMSEDGKVHFEAVAKDFWNLDQLEVEQQIEVL